LKSLEVLGLSQASIDWQGLCGGGAFRSGAMPAVPRLLRDANGG